MLPGTPQRVRTQASAAKRCNLTLAPHEHAIEFVREIQSLHLPRAFQSSQDFPSRAHQTAIVSSTRGGKALPSPPNVRSPAREVTLLQMLLEVGRIERATGRLLNQRVGLEERALPPDLLTQPAI